MNMTTEFEKKTVKKTMLRILPFILSLYIIAYLDRVNLGFAALEMNADLALRAETYGLLAGIFFVGYFFFEVPSNMILSKVGARLWITRIMISWGILVICTGFVQSASHLYILRFLLGIAEAGFFPGIILYLTYWFRERDRGTATAILLLALPLGSLIGAPLSTWIIDNVSWAGLAGWRWMFILEGIPALILGVMVIFYLTDRPKDAKWLTDDEKNWLESELTKERSQSVKVNAVSKRAMLLDLKVWKLALIYFANYTCIYGLSFWMPTLLKNLSATNITNMEVGWLAMIPPLIGVPAIILAGFNSDRTGKYREHLIISFVISAVGFIGCMFTNTPLSMSIMLAFTSMGLYMFAGCFFAYKTQFFTEATAPVGIAIVNSVAALGGFIGPSLLGIFTASSGMLFLSVLCFVAVITLYRLKGIRRSEDLSINVTESIYND